MSDYRELDATALCASIVAGERSAEDAVRSALDSIEAHDAKLGAFLSVDADDALQRARSLDSKLAGGAEPGPLHGVPVALKGNMCLQGSETNCGSRILAGYRPPYTATFVQRLLDAGAVPVGKTNLDEFAMGSSSENSGYGPTRNPWDVSRTPGGSSSGSAVAVATGMVPIALGSDTGGSVRQPAAMCGVVGFKPTYGRVSRYGLVAFGSSLDQVSPFGRSVRDVERVLGVIAGADPLDATCLADAPPPIDPRPMPIAGVKLGIPDELFSDDLHVGVRARVDEALAKLGELGVECKPVSLPHARYAIPVYYVVAAAEASSNLARYDGVRYGSRSTGDGTLQGMIAASREDGFGAEVKRRILLGTYVLSSGYYEAWYGRALRARRLVANDFDAAFEEVDLIACPTTPTPAFKLGEKADDPVAMYLSDSLTVPVSLAGLPAVSLPCGFVPEDGHELPIGLQLVGPARQDSVVLGLAQAFEAATDHARLPVLSRAASGGRA